MLTDLILGLILLTAAAGVYLFFDYKRGIAGVLSRIDDKSGGLIQQLQKHQVAIEQMPGSFEQVVSKEVGAGLSETITAIRQLKDHLAETHNAFLQLIENIPHLDEMPGWLSEVKAAIAPMQTAAKGLESLDDKIIERFNTFMGGRDNMENAFLEVTQVIKEWKVNAEDEHKSFNRAIENNLISLNQQVDHIAAPLDTIQDFAKSNDGLIKGLSIHLPDTVTQLDQLSKKTTGLVEAATQHSERVMALVGKWEQQAKQHQWQVWVGYGVMAVNVVVLFIFLLMSLKK